MSKVFQSDIASGASNSAKITDNVSKIDFHLQLPSNGSGDLGEDQQQIILSSSPDDLFELFDTLPDVVIDLECRSLSFKNILSQINLAELAIASEAQGNAVVIKSINSRPTVIISYNLSNDKGFIPFTAQKPLELTIKNGTIYTVQAFAYATSPFKATGVSKLERNVVLANQYTPISVIPTATKYIIPDSRTIDLTFNNGMKLPLQVEEVKALQHQDGFIALVSSNVCLSNIDESLTIPTVWGHPNAKELGVLSRIDFYSLDSDKFYYVLRQESLI